MNEQPVSVSKISWQDLCPWTNIFKTLSIAISPSVLTWAIVGVVLSSAGWLVSESLFFDEAMRDSPSLTAFAQANHSPYQSVLNPGFSEIGLPNSPTADSRGLFGGISGGPISGGPKLVFDQISAPFRKLYQPIGGTWRFLYFGFGAIWSLLVWSFCGVAITRVCLLRLTRNEALSISDACGFACKKYLDCVGAVAMPLIGVAMLGIPMFGFGLLLSFDIGAFLVSLIWFLVLAIALVMVILLLGLWFGWPLIVSSISAEGQNSFDATTRAYAYTMQRPINYVFYMLIAILFGGFCWMIVSFSTQAVIDMSYWSASWGTDLVNGERIETLQADGEASSALAGAKNVIGFWVAFGKTIAAAFLYGLFWCMASAVYLLLRKDVDETELDEIYIADEQRTYDLPPLKSDEFGIPQIQNPMPNSEPRQDAP